jgi:hypothetical protein
MLDDSYLPVLSFFQTAQSYKEKEKGEEIRMAAYFL